MVNKYWSGLSLAFIFSSICYAGENTVAIKGWKDNLLTFRQFDQRYGGWADVEFSNAGDKFRLYAIEKGVVANPYEEILSPDKKYLMVQRTNAGEIVDEQGNSIISAQAYCDMVSLETGCVKNVGSIQQCDGIWVAQKWKTSTGDVFDFLKEGLSPSQLVSKTSSLLPDEGRLNSLREWLFMGAESYMACFPQKENISALNDIGFYLANEGEHVIAMQIYKRLLDIAPSRIPLKLNTADSLWALGERNEAKLYYAEYRDAMMQNGNRAKIPKRVESRAE
ncbi:tetratricopeptide repeat protein [Pseudomonas kitaguniensis]|uniref:tetratricopeptide repeat protein n=1 Tax=Pseudomonas kitaguniensis TaxID=2607908 RepID=UPI003D045984